MAQETFVVFVYIIIDNCFLTLCIVGNRCFEAVHNLFQYGIIEHQLFAIHYGLHVCFGQ